ncbi:peptidoglycan DD-metalloendopeptidase family protein [Vibrio sp. WJH972]
MRKHFFRLIFFAISFAVLVGCASYIPASVSDVSGQSNNGRGEYRGSYYKVKKGDTLYFISYLTDKNVNDLIAYNALTPPYTIYPGQKLSLWSRSYQAPQYGKRSYSVDNPELRSNGSSRSQSNISIKTASKPSVGKASEATSVVGSAVSQRKPLTENALKNSKNERNSNISANKSDVVKKDPVNSIESKQIKRYGSFESQETVNNNKDSNFRDRQSKIRNNNEVKDWLWPTKGRVIAKFSTGDQGNKGIDIAGQRGQAIVATADGSVVYSGDALRGYGNLVIIKHNDNYLSAYAHNDRLLVKEGQNITAGQKIATMGSTGTSSVRLHFEIRYQGKSMNPIRYLK